MTGSNYAGPNWSVPHDVDQAGFKPPEITQSLPT